MPKEPEIIPEKPPIPVYVGDIPLEQWIYRWPTLRIDQFNNFEKMELVIIDMLEHMLKFCSSMGLQHKINSDYRDDDTGQHGKGKAVDFVLYKKVLGDFHWLYQFHIALRFDFTGIGVYPCWNTPGIHVDSRDIKFPKALWWRDKDNAYRRMEEMLEVIKS